MVWQVIFSRLLQSIKGVRIQKIWQLWAKKTHAMALDFTLQTDMNQIFWMRYCMLLYVKRLQKYQRSKLEVDKKFPTLADSSSMSPGSGWSGRFFSTSNFDLWYFCSLLTYKDVQYLIWKIWFRSVWRMKAKIIAWL